jgi:diguanylate cyclase (GGDEF)-like protein
MATPSPRTPSPETIGLAFPNRRSSQPSQVALLVGLDGSSRKEASRWLASSGFEMAVADDAPRALELMSQVRPHVVLVDMSGVDGRGANPCQMLREQAVPLLALCPSARHAGEALAGGAADVLERPYDWRLASLRSRRLAQLAEAQSELGRVRGELEAFRKSVEDERRERTWSAHFDPLTGLPDGERLERALESSLAAASEARQVAVVLFKVEHLVMVNNRLGRALANSVLKQVAQRLVEGLRSEEVARSTAGPSLSMAARLGGGLFAVMLTGLRGVDHVKTVVRQMLDLLAPGYLAGDEEITLTTSAGVAVAPEDGLAAETLLQKAELAAYEAVQDGRAIRFYGQSTHRMSERSRAVTRLLPTALARGDFRLHYQPFIDGGSRRVCAAEALLRWDSAELGQVAPAEFVPLAEEAGLMVSLGSWVLETACRQARTWLDQGLALDRIAVNVSLCQLARGNLAQQVRNCLQETRIEPSLLELELSERGVLRSDPEILRQLHEIRALGVRLALDDFGTGNSAITYLKQFPIDVLKIDQSLVRGVNHSPEDAAITSATIAMARQLGLRVVAEGVEEQGQMDFLTRHGCNEYQGFLFSPAVAPEQFADLLRGGLGNSSNSCEDKGLR